MNQRERIEHMENLLWHLTPAELARLAVRTTNGDVHLAIGMRVEDATRWRHDNFDVPHYCGNPFHRYHRDHPVHGPEPRPWYDNDVSECPF